MINKSLVLNAISVILIIMKNRLINEMPMNPQSYSHGYDFYRHCLRFRETLGEMIDFLLIDDGTLDPDLHLLLDRFVADLNFIRDQVQDLSIQADYSPESNNLIFFDLYIKRMLKGLYTTLCPIGACDRCKHF